MAMRRKLILLVVLAAFSHSAYADNIPPAELVSEFWGQAGQEVAYAEIQNDGKKVLYLSVLFFQKSNLLIFTFVHWRGWKWEFRGEDILEILRLTDGKTETLWKRAPPAAQE